jgi:hypothetical protein
MVSKFAFKFNLKRYATVFFAVPRVWEKFAEALQAVGKKTTAGGMDSCRTQLTHSCCCCCCSCCACY